ncbi:MAG: LPS export ABC transporter periplasmic protein LptC, partial [Bacillota bacterium]
GVSGTGSPAASTPAQDSGRVPGVHTAEVHLVGRRRGERQWELRAERIDLPQARRQVVFSRVSRGVLYREGRTFLLFDGDGGRYDEKTGGLVLDGGVTLRDPGGGVLVSSDLVWDAGRQVLFSEAPTTLSRGSSVVRAARMEVDVKAGVVRLSGGVRAEDPQAGGLTVQAAGAEYVPDTGEIRLAGPARLEVSPPPPDG